MNRTTGYFLLDKLRRATICVLIALSFQVINIQEARADNSIIVDTPLTPISIYSGVRNQSGLGYDGNKTWFYIGNNIHIFFTQNNILRHMNYDTLTDTYTVGDVKFGGGSLHYTHYPSFLYSNGTFKMVKQDSSKLYIYESSDPRQFPSKETRLINSVNSFAMGYDNLGNILIVTRSGYDSDYPFDGYISESKGWERVTMPSSIYEHPYVSNNGQVFTRANKSSQYNLYTFNGSTGSWTSQLNIPSGVTYAGIFQYSDKVFVAQDSLNRYRRKVGMAWDTEGSAHTTYVPYDSDDYVAPYLTYNVKGTTITFRGNLSASSQGQTLVVPIKNTSRALVLDASQTGSYGNYNYTLDMYKIDLLTRAVQITSIGNATVNSLDVVSNHNDVVNGTNVKIYRSLSSNMASATKIFDYSVDNRLSVTDTATGLVPNTRYYFRIDSSWGDKTLSSTVKNLYTLAKVPGAVSYTSSNSNSIQTTWNKFDNGATTVYVLERSPNGTTSWVERYRGTANSFNDTVGLTPNTEYYYRVKAINGNGIETAYASVTSKKTTAPVTVPEISSPVGDSYYPISVPLSASSTAPGNPTILFDWQYSLDGTTWANITTAQGVTATVEWTMPAGWADGSTVYVRARARANGETTNWTSAVSFKKQDNPAIAAKLAAEQAAQAAGNAENLARQARDATISIDEKSQSTLDILITGNSGPLGKPGASLAGIYDKTEEALIKIDNSNLKQEEINSRISEVMAILEREFNPKIYKLSWEKGKTITSQASEYLNINAKSNEYTVISIFNNNNLVTQDILNSPRVSIDLEQGLNNIVVEIANDKNSDSKEINIWRL